jgi:hypothetical protein
MLILFSSVERVSEKPDEAPAFLLYWKSEGPKSRRGWFRSAGNAGCS